MKFIVALSAFLGIASIAAAIPTAAEGTINWHGMLSKLTVY